MFQVFSLNSGVYKQIIDWESKYIFHHTLYTWRRTFTTVSGQNLYLYNTQCVSLLYKIQSCHFVKTNTCIWSIGLRRVLIPRGDFFDPAILTHFMAKNCPKSAINGTPSHKHAWRLQNGGSVRIKVGSRQDTSGGMCWDHFPGPKWPSGGAIGPQNGSMHQ